MFFVVFSYKTNSRLRWWQVEFCTWLSTQPSRKSRLSTLLLPFLLFYCNQQLALSRRHTKYYNKREAKTNCWKKKVHRRIVGRKRTIKSCSLRCRTDLSRREKRCVIRMWSPGRPSKLHLLMRMKVYVGLNAEMSEPEASDATYGTYSHSNICTSMFVGNLIQFDSFILKLHHIKYLSLCGVSGQIRDSSVYTRYSVRKSKVFISKLGGHKQEVSTTKQRTPGREWAKIQKPSNKAKSPTIDTNARTRAGKRWTQAGNLAGEAS